MTDVAAAMPPPESLDRSSRCDSPIARRAVARLIDFSLGLALFFAMAAIISAAGGHTPDGTGVMIGAIGITFLLDLAYEVILIAALGRTLGKQLMGLEVVRADGRGRPGLRRSSLRNLVPTVLLVGFFPLYPLPYLAAAVAKDHRWPHDRLAGTCVIVRRSPRSVWPAAPPSASAPEA